MLSVNYERYIHYKNHIYDPNINYILLTNCKYCKQDKRDYYGSQFRQIRQPSNINRTEVANMDLLNYRRVQNVIGYTNNDTNIRNVNISNDISNDININPFPRYLPQPIRIPYIQRNFRQLPHIPSQIPIIQSNIQLPSAQIHNYTLRNRPHIQNYFPSNIQSSSQTNRPRQIHNNIYFTNNLGIQPIQEVEIEDFEEMMDVEVKTILQDVNNSTELEVYKGENNSYCIICCEDICNSQIVRKINCGHKFHYKCIDEWLETNTKCPICRYDIENYNKEIDEI
jgi:hypothetical protein